MGVNVVGPFEAELGNGETARMVVTALRAAGEPVLPIGFVASASRQGHRFAHLVEAHDLFPQTILCVNADHTPRFAPAYARTRRIGVWWWEVDPLPSYLAESFRHVDELWAGSAYLQRIMAAAAPPDVPVVSMDVPVLAPRPAPLDRAALGLPDGFLVLFSFDHNSVAGRKNPLGAIAAFRRAFGPGEATLILKSINGDRHPDAHANVLAAAAEAGDVVIRDGYVDPGTRDALLAASDCYLSLHRSEGFGLTLAEALLLERPVVATAASGEADFLNAETGFPVRATPALVGPGADPYPPDAHWFEPDLDHAAQQLRAVRADPPGAARRAAAGARYVAERYAVVRCGERMARRLRDAGGLRTRLRAWTPEARRATSRARALS